MTHKSTGQLSATDLLHEAQNYRTGLESLMAVGQAMLANPSLEDNTATAFQLLAENVLEEADHQGDLQVVEGVEEPQARVELIMQDVLTPRLTEIEAIEQSLMEKAEAEEPVPFTTRDSETASQESLYTAEVVGLYRENVELVRQILSMEALSVDQVRPMVIQVAKRVEGNLEALGISMEALEETQVLGEMSDAVERIEALVNKAHESAIEQAEAARSEAESVGSDGSDPMGDAIERHRSENASGAVLDAETTVTSIQHEVADAITSDDNADVEVSGTDEGVTDDLDETDLDAATDATVDAVADDAGVEAEGGEPALVDAEADVVEAADDLDAVTDEAGETADEGTVDDAANDVPDAAAVDAAHDSGDAEVDAAEVDAADASETTDNDTDSSDDEEEDEDKKASTESMDQPVVFESLAVRSEDQEKVKDILNSLMTFLGEHDMLTDIGQSALSAGLSDDFAFDSSMVSPQASEVLARHYQTWVTASVRDGDANLRAMGALLDI